MRTGHKPDSKKKWYITIGKNNPPDESDIIEKNKIIGKMEVVIMLVGDLIYNDNFDCNCNYAIYDCTEGGVQWDEAKIIHSTIQHGYSKPKDAILDMKIKYITTSDNILIVEATR